jgi:hypothetical protein
VKDRFRLAKLIQAVNAAAPQLVFVSPSGHVSSQESWLIRVSPFRAVELLQAQLKNPFTRFSFKKIPP